METGCSLKIESILENSPSDPNTQPFPQFFSEPNCEGDVFPPTYGPISDHTFTPAMRSYIVPDGWDLDISVDNELTLHGNTFVATSANITYISSMQPKQTQDQVTAEFCMGRYAAFYSTPFKNEYYPTSAQCDNFMASYCNESANEDLPECSCFTEQKELQAQYPDLLLPVACFGATCRVTGYETDEMFSQDCTVPICQQLIVANTDPFIDEGTSNITCGGRDFYIPDLPSPIPTDTPHSTTVKPPTETTPAWVIFVALAGGIAIAILIAMAIIYL